MSGRTPAQQEDSPQARHAACCADMLAAIACATSPDAIAALAAVHDVHASACGLPLFSWELA